MKSKKYLTIPEVAKLLGVSRIAIYNKVKKGKIKATKIGRNYAISKKYIYNILKDSLDETKKKEITDAVKRTVDEYGEVLKLLGRE